MGAQTDRLARGEQQAGPEPRGVSNSRVIDLITTDRESGEVVLVMLEERPWNQVPHPLLELEAKVNSYLSYIQAGYLVRDYPAYTGRPLRVQLDCATSPGPRENPFLTAVRNHAAAENVRFVVHVISP